MGLEEFNQIEDDGLQSMAHSTEEMNDEVEIMYDELVTQTPDAIRFKFGDELHWIPKSQMRAGDGKSIYIPSWLAFEKELI